ncbi:MAG: hypothetical protein M3137_01580 [Actinomycetota bacterium]|nr:hypothetical protein [Actinomycetota bacterium]
MRPFVINRHGRMVFPSSYFPEVDLSVFPTLGHFERAVQRDFEKKAPTGTDIAERVSENKYPNRFELLRDLPSTCSGSIGYALTLYEKRPTRWRDVPKASDTLFLRVVTPWEDGKNKVAAVAEAYRGLPPGWDEAVEDRIYAVLFDVAWMRWSRHSPPTGSWP